MSGEDGVVDGVDVVARHSAALTFERRDEVLENGMFVTHGADEMSRREGPCSCTGRRQLEGVGGGHARMRKGHTGEYRPVGTEARMA